ncbi:MAG TPA: bifunctional hydroxymethylpyrimidine kinase/phosphomethylpyrimidine kinase [Terriglobales bacterium]|nr:bifunctional hydroxymethylpyrimidine kinase/phosphomethylpyrimidine kinase [Terriglobales bacterium]
MPPTPPVILSIAGFDPSSGAGVSADIKTIGAHGCYGLGCITALTVQSTQGVRKVEPVSGKLIAEMLRELANDISISAVRIGMLGNGEVVDAVGNFLGSVKPPNVVLDPILKSTSGAKLLNNHGPEKLRSLIPLAHVLTPNIEEAAALSGVPVTNLEQMKVAALKLHDMGAANVVVTGGHLEKAIDLLSIKQAQGPPKQTEFGSNLLRSTSTHGTGCAFATAVACNLALGRQLEDAVIMAKVYVTKAIAKGYPLGKGPGPLNHLYRMEETPRPAAEFVEPVHR